jgi:hypothetical protein
MHEFNRLVDKMDELRFSSRSKEAFNLIKRVTQYHRIEKRDGGLVTKAYRDGRLLTGEELDRALAEHYSSIHSSDPPLPAVNFPTNLDLSDA